MAAFMSLEDCTSTSSAMGRMYEVFLQIVAGTAW